MSRIVVFGAGGRAGSAVVAEAAGRGHTVTAVVRDPDAFPGLARDGVTVVRGDVDAPADVARVVAGHDAIVNAVTPLKGPQDIGRLDPLFFVRTGRHLVDAATKHGVSRLVLVGHFSNLVTRSGALVADVEEMFPPFLRGFSQSHTDGLKYFEGTPEAIDWVMLSPPANLDVEGPRTGTYRVGGADLLPEHHDTPAHLSYADLAVAMVDEIDNPKHHRTRVSVFD